MLKSLKITKDWRCFKKDQEFTFVPGVNLFVGEQGSGKSSLITLIRNPDRFKEHFTWKCKACKTRALDFERESPRQKSYVDSVLDVAVGFMSHGQMVNGILEEFERFKDLVIIMDEPDTALSIRSCYALADKFKLAASNNCQIIASIHSPIIIGQFPNVLSTEHGGWVTSEFFIKSHTK